MVRIAVAISTVSLIESHGLRVCGLHEGPIECQPGNLWFLVFANINFVVSFERQLQIGISDYHPAAEASSSSSNSKQRVPSVCFSQ